MSTEFRFQNTKCMLTYKTHVDKEVMHDFIESLCATEFLRIAHENADPECPYEHSHVLIKFKKIFQSRNARIFDFTDIHPHIQLLKTQVHWRNAIQYIAKEDEANADLKTTQTVVEKVWNADSVSEALKQCTNLRDVIPTIAAFNAKPEDDEPLPPPEEWRPWQRSLLNIITGPVHPREIIWIVDPKGGAGKSVLTRYISDWMSGICLTQAPGQRETANLLKQFMPINGKTIVFDFARQTADKQFYEPMEHIKNGMMTSTKYEGRTLKWRPGHVVVMANFPPEKGKWTWDRYAVYKIDKQSDLKRLKDKRRILTLEDAPQEDPAPQPCDFTTA